MRRAVLSAVGRTSPAAARLMHHGTKDAAVPWSLPASSYRRTLMTRPAAQMALHLWLLGDVGDQMMPCGEKITAAGASVPGVRPTEEGSRHVVHCKSLFTRRHPRHGPCCGQHSNHSHWCHGPLRMRNRCEGRASSCRCLRGRHDAAWRYRRQRQPRQQSLRRRHGVHV